MLEKLLFIILIIIPLCVQSQSPSNDDFTTDEKMQLRAVAEIGYLGVLDHKIQFSNSGTYFDYKNDGGQDVLFAVSRYSLELDLNRRNTLVFLYQPLQLESQVLLSDDLIVDDMVFSASTGVKLLYNFPFYRLSYLRELTKRPRTFTFAIGLSLQIRNATINFESSDGTKLRTNRDVGPVPILKLKTRKYFNDRLFTEVEADGFYAPISYINGSDKEIIGAILDASWRTGYQFDTRVKGFFNLRYLGGGSVGTGDIDGPGDGYLKNWLHFYTVSLGAIYDF